MKPLAMISIASGVMGILAGALFFIWWPAPTLLGILAIITAFLAGRGGASIAGMVLGAIALILGLANLIDRTPEDVVESLAALSGLLN